MTTVSIQPSFLDVIRDVKEGSCAEDSFWVNIISSKDLEDGESREEIINVSMQGDELSFSNDSGVKFEASKSPLSYKLTIDGRSHSLRAPVKTIATGVSDTSAFDISPNEDRYILGHTSGKLTFGYTSADESNAPVIVQEAHLSSVIKSLFFPSGKVALTAGLDYQIKIWDVTDGSCPRLFSGHKGRITDLKMVERGRNFISSSADGTVKLWDCGSGNNIATLRRSQSIKDGVTALDIGVGETSIIQAKSTYEFGTLGKNVYAGHESGVVTIFDLASREESLALPSQRSAVVSLGAVSEEVTLYVAYEEGTVASWDLRKPTEPLVKVDLEAELNSMALGSQSLVVSYNTGFVVELDKCTLQSKAVMVGTNDGCRLVTGRHNTFYLSGSDDVIYKY